MIAVPPTYVLASPIVNAFIVDESDVLPTKIDNPARLQINPTMNTAITIKERFQGFLLLGEYYALVDRLRKREMVERETINT